MNERQRALLRILLEENGDYLSSREIAEQLNCSEKTVRNDSKIIDKWLSKNSSAFLIRKPNIGFRLDINDSEKNKLLNSLTTNNNENTETDEEKRLAQILEWLLLENKNITLQRLSEVFYLNKTVVKKDIEKIELYLKRFNLSLTAKQKLGIEVEGSEHSFRMALAKIPEFLGSNFGRSFLYEFFQKQEILEVSIRVEEMNKQVANPYTDNALHNLTIHILIAIKRLKLGNPISVPPDTLEEVKGKKEYLLAKDILSKLEKPFSIRFPENEIVYIGLHLMGGKVQRAVDENEDNLDPEVIVITKNLINRISEMTHIDFFEDDDLFSGLAVHLQTTMNRIKHGLGVSNPILENIKKMYSYMFTMVITELVYLNKDIEYPIPEEEAAYITLHFQASIERLQKKSGRNKRVLIVCPMGIGASILLRTKLERKFESLEVVDTVSVKKINEYSPDDIDLVISTVPINDSKIPVITISPLLTDEEQNKLQAFVLNKEPLSANGEFPHLKELLKEELILFDLDFSHRFEVIEVLANKLAEFGYVKKEYAETAVIREKLSSTSIGGGMAIPHGDPSYINKTGIAVGVLNKPLQWGNDMVSLVFLLATNQKEYAKVKEIFKDVAHLSEQPILINKLVKQKNAADFLESL